MISATNFVLKKSGVYVDDYPSKFLKHGKGAEKEGSDKAVPIKGESVWSNIIIKRRQPHECIDKK